MVSRWKHQNEDLCQQKKHNRKYLQGCPDFSPPPNFLGLISIFPLAQYNRRNKLNPAWNMYIMNIVYGRMFVCLVSHKKTRQTSFKEYKYFYIWILFKENYTYQGMQGNFEWHSMHRGNSRFTTVPLKPLSD